MHTYKLLSMILTVTLASAGMPSCSSYKPKFVHLDFADRVYLIGPTMGEKASGHAKIDSSIKGSNVFFLVNESNPKYYADSVIDRFIDTNRFIREEIAKRYHELTVHFYHRGDYTAGLLEDRSIKALILSDKDIISEYVWRDGRPSDTLYYENGQIKDGQNIQLEDMRKKKKS
ncbi:MAG TPA: hypothetical protein VGS79_08505 [Puia sp.]|nr:hypothetical protein [Puia sp.]